MVFALIAFWTGAGGWILVIHGALTNIPGDVLEAAQLDGASPLQTALRIKLPLIKKWIVYMLIVSFAGGTQLFAEPALISQASRSLVGGFGGSWSPNQLATSLAFESGNFNYAAAISIDLLVIALVCAGRPRVPDAPLQGGLVDAADRHRGDGVDRRRIQAAAPVALAPTRVGPGRPCRGLLPRADRLAGARVDEAGAGRVRRTPVGVRILPPRRGVVAGALFRHGRWRINRSTGSRTRRSTQARAC